MKCKGISYLLAFAFHEPFQVKTHIDEEMENDSSPQIWIKLFGLKYSSILNNAIIVDPSL